MELMSSEISALAKALCEAQSEFSRAHKDSNNPFFKSKYADLESIWEAAAEALHKHGLSIAQHHHDGNLVTTLLHSSGQWVRGFQPLFLKDQSPQALGSATTYARRYGLAAILGIIQADDDGEAGQGRGKKEKGETNEGKSKQASGGNAGNPNRNAPSNPSPGGGPKNIRGDDGPAYDGEPQGKLAETIAHTKEVFEETSGPPSPQELRRKIEEAKALKHLANIWEKYKPLIGSFPKADQEMLLKAKDSMKQKLQPKAV